MFTKTVTTACLALFVLAGGQAIAAEGAKPEHTTKHHTAKMSCYGEAKHKGIKDKKERHAFIEKCKSERRAEARKHKVAKKAKHEQHQQEQAKPKS